jgi:hypothetical protein
MDWPTAVVLIAGMGCFGYVWTTRHRKDELRVAEIKHLSSILPDLRSQDILETNYRKTVLARIEHLIGRGN